MEKYIKGIGGMIAIGFFVIFLTTGAFAFEYGLGDLGKPADYDQTIKDFREIIPDFDDFVKQLPSSFQHYRVSAAKNQGSCGSCWAFACAGVLESRVLMRDFGSEPIVLHPNDSSNGRETFDSCPDLYDLSEQEQVSCNLSQAGCCGGNSNALTWWEGPNGPMQESCTGYGDSSTSCTITSPIERTVSCSSLSVCTRKTYYTNGYYTVDTSSNNYMKASLYADGPAYFRFDVYSDFNTFWSTGLSGQVYTHSSGTYRGGHAVLLIGWDDSKNAWLCKNSWGATGGPDGNGRFWMAYSGHSTDLNFGMASCSMTTASYLEGGLAVDFTGSDISGLLNWASESWSPLSTADAEWISTYNGKLVGDFGSMGVWENDGTSWSQISTSNADNTGNTMVAYDGGLAVDFGSLGLYYYNGTSWSRISTNNPQWLTAYSDKLAVDFGAYGLYQYNGSAWSQISSSDTDNTGNTMVAYNNGLAVDFGSLGLWYYNGTSWSRISTNDPEWLVADKNLLVGDFGSDGLWEYNGTTWHQISTSNADNTGNTMVAYDGGLAVDFGSTYGLWYYKGSWMKIEHHILSGEDVEWLTVYDGKLIVDFGHLGVWESSGELGSYTRWIHISNYDPDNSGNTMISWQAK